MNKEDIILMTALKNAKDLLNSVSFEAVSCKDRFHLEDEFVSDKISNIAWELGYLENFVKEYKNK